MNQVKEKQCKLNEVESSKEDYEEENNSEEKKLQQLQTINSTLNGTYLTDQELPNQTFSSASNVFGDL